MKKIKGSCLCKSISFEILNECRYSVLCHCTMCQKSNAEFSNYTKVQKNNFKFLRKKNLKWFFSSKNFTAPNIGNILCPPPEITKCSIVIIFTSITCLKFNTFFSNI